MKIGDTVRFLNSQGGGRVARIDGQLAYVEDEDGFEVPVLQRECVVVASASDAMMAATVDAASQGKDNKKDKKSPVSAPAAAKPDMKPEPAEETPDGDTINLTLAFAASDIKHLSDLDTSYDTFIVNDSNYLISYTLAAKADSDSRWTLLSRGEIEPNIQEFILEMTREMLPTMDRLALQFTACKTDRPYELREPVSVNMRFDTTKFFKLNCFRPSNYFDEPVIELPVVTSGHPAGVATAPDPDVLRRNLLEKRRIDNRRARPVAKRSQPKATPGSPLVVDLHIAELVDSTRGLSNADMLNLQIDRFREVMDANLRNNGMKIIFIHGKGEGVLRSAIMKELNHRYKGHDVQDASFREYGFGATQVTIR